MATAFERLNQLSENGLLEHIGESRVGIERETLRITEDGTIAQTPHPHNLGSALTHSYITTDFSEALLEFITPPNTQIDDTLFFLNQVHAFTGKRLQSEFLWPLSMPCFFESSNSIPIANYGDSNVGRMKRIYRTGLCHRYGRAMQCIAGVHVNYSLPIRLWRRWYKHELPNGGQPLAQWMNAHHMRILRNFMRTSWIVSYAFGASPALDRSFMINQPGTEGVEQYSKLGDDTYYLPYATSLRMSDIGYKNDAQSNLTLNYDELDRYIHDLERAMRTPYHPYESLGIKINGEYKQLNANILQIENEFYNVMRPKQIARSGERPTVALKKRGIRYMELRALDIDPFSPTGVNSDTIHVLESLFLYCLLSPSPALDSNEIKEINQRQIAVAKYGRDPELKFEYSDHHDNCQNHILRLFDELGNIAELLDQHHESDRYSSAINKVRATIEDNDKLPSKKLLDRLLEKDISFNEFGMQLAQQHLTHLHQTEVDDVIGPMLDKESAHSLKVQSKIEKTDHMSFEHYLDRYFSSHIHERETFLN